MAVTTFASNVGRLRAIAEAAHAADREVVLVGRAMERVVQVARETGYLDGIGPFRSQDTYGYLPPDKVLALAPARRARPARRFRASPRTSTRTSRSRAATW